jgi:hypothetical protein
MKPLTTVVLVLLISAGPSGCSGSGDTEMSPEQLHESCIAVFERKGGPAEMGKQMCDSMKEACENDPSGEECRKAHRIVRKG